MSLGRILILVSLAIFLIWFNWETGIKPLFVVSEVNILEGLMAQGDCPAVIEEIQKQYKKDRGPLEAWEGFKYTEFILGCRQYMSPKIAGMAIEILVSALEARPNYSRGWHALGNFAAYFAEDAVRTGKDQETIMAFADKADEAYEKAFELRPNFPEASSDVIRLQLIVKDYEVAELLARSILDVDLRIGSQYLLSIDWWLLARAQISQGNLAMGQHSILQADKNGFYPWKEDALVDLTQAYAAALDHIPPGPWFIKPFKDLAEQNPENTQYQAALATAYARAGMPEEAMRQALDILKKQPELENEVNEFIQKI